MQNESARSFTAAGALPWKLLQIKEQCIGPDKKVVPVHIQLIPTNKCNGNCPWCSCSKVDRSEQLSIEEIRDLLEFFAKRGTRAITITGGGEPTLHPNFIEIIDTCRRHSIEVGLVSNGVKWSTKGFSPADYLFLSGALSWLRVSTMNTSEHGDQAAWLQNISMMLTTHMGASFTVGEGVSIPLAQEICKVAKHRYNITHVRFVSDILNPDAQLMEEVKAACESITDKAIFQCRAEFTEGAPKCMISLLKPMISADGHVYPCCGVQYANEEFGLRTMPKKFDMGHWSKYDEMKPFNGGACKKCYYNDYNKVLAGMTQQLQHVYHV